jgi:uncharacterized protein DUF3667
MTVVNEPACLNCGRPLSGAFCAGCGQKRTPLDLTLTEFLHETTRELTNWDGKIPATLKALFFEPGRLTADFLGGRRARWLPPLRLYLICSVAYFVSGPMVEAVTHRSRREIAKVTITNDEGRTALTPAMRKEIEAGLPARIFGMDRIERAVADPARLNREVEAALPKEMFLLLPLFAAFTRVAWRRKAPRYPAHLYLALHLHAAWFGVLALLTLIGGFVTWLPALTAAGIAALAYALWYGLAAVRRVFADSWPLTLAKSAAVAAVYSMCLFALSLGVLAYVLFRM